MWISGLRGIGVLALAKRSVTKFAADDLATYAAAVAYQVLFAIFPFLIFLVALLGTLGVADFFDWLNQQAQAFLPQAAMELVDAVLAEIQQQSGGGLLSFGIGIALVLASSGVRMTMHALNIAFGVKETRPTWKLYPLSLVYTVGLAVMLILAAALMLIGPRVMEWLAGWVGLGQAFVVVWAVLRLPLAILLLMFAVAIVYYVAPAIDQPFRLITPGSVLAVAVWVAASLGFSFYVANFADYSAIYGSLGAVVVLLFYFYISAAVLLFGAEVNAVIDGHAQHIDYSQASHQRR